jgi:hypothetical protein
MQIIIEIRETAPGQIEIDTKANARGITKLEMLHAREIAELVTTSLPGIFEKLGSEHCEGGGIIRCQKLGGN